MTLAQPWRALEEVSFPLLEEFKGFLSHPHPPDDGKLSFEEFQNYFADGVLSPGELRELFSGVYGHPAE